MMRVVCTIFIIAIKDLKLYLDNLNLLLGRSVI